jgi:hypothetical protein
MRDNAPFSILKFDNPEVYTYFYGHLNAGQHSRLNVTDVANFKYLGTILTNESKIRDEVEQQFIFREMLSIIHFRILFLLSAPN